MSSAWRILWQRLHPLRRPRLAFVLAALLALAVLLVGETAYRNNWATLEGLNVQGAARSDIELLWRRLTDAEVGSQDDLPRAGEPKHVAVAHGAMSGNLTLHRAAVAGLVCLGLLLTILHLRHNAANDKRHAHQVLLAQRERDELEARACARTCQLTELAQHLQTAREDERERLARVLHDELGAVLTAAKLDVARLKSRLATPAPELLERVAHLSDTLNNGISLKRRLVEDLRPSTLANLGLVTALEVLTHEWSEHHDLPVQTSLEKVALRPSAALSVYRLVQEALTNIGKHAAAGKVSVMLESREGQVFVSVHDDGVGFDSAAPRSAGHGLLGLHYRLQAESGELAVVSSPGAGTRIEAVLPESA